MTYGFLRGSAALVFATCLVVTDVFAADAVNENSATIQPPVSAQSADGERAKVIARARSATVAVLQHTGKDDTPSEGMSVAVRGTGVHLRDGYILTAYHVGKESSLVDNILAKEIRIFTENLEELPAKLVGSSAYLDIAVYQVDGSALATPLGNAQLVEQDPGAGDEIFTVGYPLGWGPAIWYGKVGNTRTFLPKAQTRLMQIDMSACSGNSGGGIFNSKSELVGIVHAIIPTETGQEERLCTKFAFAIPGHLINRAVNEIIEGKNPRFSRIGIRMTTVKLGAAWRVAVAEASGPAMKGGIRKGDVLLSIGDVQVTSPAQLKTYLMEETEPGQKHDIRVQRSGSEKILSITLE